MTKNDEIVLHIIEDAAHKAKYQFRIDSEGFVGIIASAKVCNFCQWLHMLMVKELDSRDNSEKVTQ